MAIFITQGRFTREYIKGGWQSPRTGKLRSRRFVSRRAGSCSTCISRLVRTTSSSSRKCPTRRPQRSLRLSPLVVEASRIR